MAEIQTILSSATSNKCWGMNRCDKEEKEVGREVRAWNNYIHCVDWLFMSQLLLLVVADGKHVSYSATDIISLLPPYEMSVNLLLLKNHPWKAVRDKHQLQHKSVCMNWTKTKWMIIGIQCLSTTRYLSISGAAKNQRFYFCAQPVTDIAIYYRL